MPSTIAVFGGSFDPPGEHHRVIAAEIAMHFDDIVIVPSGPRPDKPRTWPIDPQHRAIMMSMAFRDIPNLAFDFSDLTEECFTRTFDLDTRFKDRGERWHVVGSDLVEGGRRQESQVHSWYRGREIWYNFNIAVVARPGYPLDAADLPPRSRIFGCSRQASSSDIRRRITAGQSITGLVNPQVEEFIKQRHLYGARS
ncbi:MAG: hypothetical protein AAB692_02145 [Patescibacteria group bacterium]